MLWKGSFSATLKGLFSAFITPRMEGEHEAHTLFPVFQLCKVKQLFWCSAWGYEWYSSWTLIFLPWRWWTHRVVSETTVIHASDSANVSLVQMTGWVRAAGHWTGRFEEFPRASWRESKMQERNRMSRSYWWFLQTLSVDASYRTDIRCTAETEERHSDHLTWHPFIITCQEMNKQSVSFPVKVLNYIFI